MCIVTTHAAQRYVERVEPVSIDEARAKLTAAAKVVNGAARFGATTVIMGNGARLVLKGDVVATVLPKRCHRRPRNTITKGGIS